jgi:hypothetical protein
MNTAHIRSGAAARRGIRVQPQPAIRGYCGFRRPGPGESEARGPILSGPPLVSSRGGQETLRIPLVTERNREYHCQQRN